jgi:hypothetical protein
MTIQKLIPPHPGHCQICGEKKMIRHRDPELPDEGYVCSGDLPWVMFADKFLQKSGLERPQK